MGEITRGGRDKDPHAFNIPGFASTAQWTQQYLSGLLGTWSASDRGWSLPRHYRQLQTLSSALSECPPEYYYLPEALSSLREVEYPRYTRPSSAPAFVRQFIIRHSASRFDHLFVYLQRLMLESRHVSSMLHHWIDLFFGVNSRGKPAKAAKNLYPPSVYPEKAGKIMGEKGPSGLLSYRQVWEGGQLPAQVFWTPHPSKNVGLIEQLRPRCYSAPGFKPYVASFNLAETENMRPIRGCSVEFLSDTIIISTNVGVTSIKTSIARNPKDSRVEKLSCSILDRTEINKLLGFLESQKVVCHFTQLIVIGGYLDGSLKFVSSKTGEQEKSFKPNGSIVTALACATNFILGGFSNGEILVWEINSQLQLRKVARIDDLISNRGTYVSKIQVADGTPFAVISLTDGTILFMNFVDGAVLNILQGSHHAEQVIGWLTQVSVCFGSPSCIIAMSGKILTMSSHTLSGEPIAKAKLESKLVAPILITKSVEFSDIAMSVDSKGQLLVWQLPFLKLVSATNLNLLTPHQAASKAKNSRPRANTHLLPDDISLDGSHFRGLEMPVEVVGAAIDPISQLLVIVHSDHSVYCIAPN